MLERSPHIDGKRVYLRVAAASDILEIVDYYRRNRDALKAVEPHRPEAFYDMPYWQLAIKEIRREFQHDDSVRLIIRKKDDDSFLGLINFTGISRGTFQSCRVGYSLDHHHKNKGYMTEALIVAIKYIFHEKNLHRVQAAHLPENTASQKVLEKVGFHTIGLAPAYLMIDGEWRDHILSSIINPFWQHP